MGIGINNTTKTTETSATEVQRQPVTQASGNGTGVLGTLKRFFRQLTGIHLPHRKVSTQNPTPETTTPQSNSISTAQKSEHIPNFRIEYNQSRKEESPATRHRGERMVKARVLPEKEEIPTYVERFAKKSSITQTWVKEQFILMSVMEVLPGYKKAFSEAVKGKVSQEYIDLMCFVVTLPKGFDGLAKAKEKLEAISKDEKLKGYTEDFQEIAMQHFRLNAPLTLPRKHTTTVTQQQVKEPNDSITAPSEKQKPTVGRLGPFGIRQVHTRPLNKTKKHT